MRVRAPSILLLPVASPKALVIPTSLPEVIHKHQLASRVIELRVKDRLRIGRYLHIPPAQRAGKRADDSSFLCFEIQNRQRKRCRKVLIFRAIDVVEAFSSGSKSI